MPESKEVQKNKIFPKISFFIVLFVLSNLVVVFYFWKNIITFRQGNEQILKLNSQYSQRITEYHRANGKDVAGLGDLAKYIRQEVLMLMKAQEQVLFHGLRDLILLSLLFVVSFVVLLWRSFVSLEKQTKLVSEYLYQAEREKQIIKSFTDIVPSAIYAVDALRRITLWNKKMEEITGYAEEEVLGKQCSFFAFEPCSTQNCALYSDDFNKPVIGRECRIRAKDGTELIVSKNVDALKNSEGKVIGGIETFVDITQRKNEEEEMRFVNKLLRDNEEKVKRINQELAEKITALEKANEHMKGRELRIIEIKQEVNRLSEELGIPPPYKTDY